MAAVAASLDKLKKHKEALDTHIASQNSLLYSAICTLSAEILSLMFSFVCSSYEYRTTKNMHWTSNSKMGIAIR